MRKLTVGVECACCPGGRHMAHLTIEVEPQPDGRWRWHVVGSGLKGEEMTRDLAYERARDARRQIELR